MDGTGREVLALQFDFHNPDGSINSLPVILGREGGGKHRPLDRRKTWMDLRKGSQIVLWYPGRKPEVRRIDKVVLWMSRPSVKGTPEIVSGRDCADTASNRVCCVRSSYPGIIGSAE